MDAIIAYLVSMRAEIGQIVGLSLTVSGTATLLASLVGIPLGAYVGMNEFAGRRLLLRVIYTLMALPPVLAGLLVFLLLSRSGPLGRWGLLFTPAAMIAAQFLLVTPIVTGLTAAAVASKERVIQDLSLSLGAARSQAAWAVISEARTAIMAAVLTGFGRAFAEVGAVMLVGGNIRLYSRVLTTAIVQLTRQGEITLAVSLGVILLLISFVVSSVMLLDSDQFKFD
jgi:tungstate transport system permease protein